LKKYTIKKRIKKNNASEIYLAEDNRLNRYVLIKKLLVPQNQHLNRGQKRDIITRFLNEGKTASELNHPNIITVYQVIQSKDNSCIVMELPQGKPVSVWLRNERQFKVGEVISIGVQICKALDYAHRKGITHDNINPEIVWLGDNLRTTLGDFGITATDSDSLLVKELENLIDILPGESAEEKNGSDNHDPYPDIHATGILLYRLLIGVSPKFPVDIGEQKKLISSRDPDSSPDLIEEIISVLLRAVEKDPQKNFQTANEFLKELSQLVDVKNIPENSQPAVDQNITVTKSAERKIHGLSQNIISSIKFDQVGWVMAVFNDWKKKELQNSSIRDTLGSLFEVPVYADPFSGALLVDKYCLLLFWKGHILQALDFKNRTSGERAYASLPEKCTQCTIYTADSEERNEMPLLLATILNNDQAVFDRLDSEFTDIVRYIQKLMNDRFTGVIKLLFQQSMVYLCYSHGNNILLLHSIDSGSASSGSFSDLLSQLIQTEKFTAEVYVAGFDPINESMRYFFQDASLTITYQKDGPDHDTFLAKKKGDLQPGLVEELKSAVKINPILNHQREIQLGGTSLSNIDLLMQDFGYRFCQWFLTDLFVSLISSGNKTSMKYIATWIPLIAEVKLNTYLEDDEGNNHFFDMVMTDRNGKILHLVSRGAKGGQEQITDFLETVKKIKRKHIERGDIGGVFYISDNDYDKEALNYYFKMTAEKKKQISITSIDALTGYKGFVRIGKNRGFHFGLITESPAGFNLIAPVL